MKLVALLLAALPVTIATASDRPQVMILGTFHFAATPDAFSSPLTDVHEAHRQRQIEQLVAALAEFRPTCIAVEALPGAKFLEEGYSSYLSGSESAANEIHQIAFRLAKRMGHERVNGVNYHLDANPMPVMEWAMKNGQGEIAQKLFAQFQERILPRFQPGYAKARTIAQMLADINRQEEMLFEHRLMASTLQIGTSTEPLGGELLAKTAHRNTMIASHIRQLASPGQRVFVLIGGSHRLPLERILSEAGDVEIVDCLPYVLKGDR
jgi:hypothetical protein